ncbi:MAG: 4-(cytidine 5'-diphospho)-2-C-methyl-D-erythritol kinase [Gemmatimonadota bacterium]
MSDTITAECPGKVNLMLRVLAREESGYHGIESLFARVGLSDTLEITRTDRGLTLEVLGAELGKPEDNLAWRAADAVLASTGRRFGVALRLIKRIPAGGGLGGGSSDAAQALIAVNRLAGGAVPGSELLQIGYRLGADIPFFLSGARLALGWGHGQRLLGLPPLEPMPALLLCPGMAVPTAAAYGWVDEVRAGSSPRGSVTLDLGVLASWSDLARLGGNDFEGAVFGRFPALRAAFEALALTRPFLCRMSGSGSTLFAVYRSAQDRDDAAAQLGSRHGALHAVAVG